MGAINCATRPFFAPSKLEGQAFYEDEVTFDWHNGMSWQVRQRSSDSMREAILAKYSSSLSEDDILEVSTASHNFEIGQALSAMNLLYADPVTGETHPVENWFQSSKVFHRDGRDYGPYRELLNVRLAKRYVNPNPDSKTKEQLKDDSLFLDIQNEIRGSDMCGFNLEGEEYPVIPRSAFYDYLYVSALTQPQNKQLSEGLTNFRVFTDIMFNPGVGKTRRFNTQARSCAIYVALSKRGVFASGMPSFNDFVDAVAYYPENRISEQATLF
ncbi:DarT1-associated NADAR antitoxin family protein [Slackia isoflavoniconvertens]|uniref:DarT1-associated NADAR antitoxin family protein n=1 Tax=Slackia isoflavoniconvertens TaxID=572010 RepID=UPI003FD7AA77